MKRRVVAVWGAVVLGGALVGGCGGSGASKVDGGGSGACSDYITKYCDRVQACEPGFLALGGFTSLADCVSYFVPACEDALAAPHTGETTALLQQCGDAIAAMSCADLLLGAYASACYPQGGTIAIGGACNNDWQCASGRCWAPYPDACGTCATVTSAGRPCQVDPSLGDLCPENLVCTQSPTGDGTLVCASIAPLGSACIGTELCASNDYCDPTTSACTQLPAIGQACDPTNVFYCDPTQAASSCDGYTSTCTAVGTAKDGQACGIVDGVVTNCNGPCALGDGGVGVCHTYLARGAACTPYDLCVPGTSCLAGVCSSVVCGGAGSSGSDAAVAARVKASGALDRRRALRPPGVPIGAALPGS
jgi:hypothetical protein